MESTRQRGFLAVSSSTWMTSSAKVQAFLLVTYWAEELTLFLLVAIMKSIIYYGSVPGALL
jgi:hypothetical protein